MTGPAHFETTTYYVQRLPGRDGAPAIAAFGAPGAGYVALYSSLEALAAQVGECDWASAPGAELLQLVPPGYGVVVDPGGGHPAVLPASAIRPGVVISGSRR